MKETKERDKSISDLQSEKGLIGEALVESGLITSEQLRLALDEQRVTGEAIGTILMRLHLIRADQFERFQAGRMGIARWDSEKDPPDAALLSLFPATVMEQYLAFPVRREGRHLTVASARVLDVMVRYEIERLTRFQVTLLYATEEEVRAHLSGFQERNDKSAAPASVLLPEGDGDGEAVDLIDALFEAAIASDVTDLHFEPEERVFRIRERVDGILHHRMTLKKELHLEMVARLKIMSGLDITESRMPQDGKIRFTSAKQGAPIDIRVSTFLTQHGEKTVCRILNQERFVMDLARLGLDGRNLDIVAQAAKAPHGMILVSGPTGSGKTTTLYSLISGLNTLNKNVVTIEDPIEVSLPLIQQSQINTRAGITFESGLRAILRQDPDVILIGEMRDRETTEIAMRAALTGHLVFSTIHTNDAIGVISRLKDFGVEPYLTASSLLLAVAQRLLRKICSFCKEAYQPEETLLLQVEQNRSALQMAWPEAPVYYRGRGCEMCNQTGYRGRIGVFEMLPMDSTIRKSVARGIDLEDLKEMAKEEGCTSLWEDALRKIFQGKTTLEEAVRVTQGQIFSRDI